MMLGSDDPIDLTQAGIQSVLSKPGVVTDLSNTREAPVGLTTEDQWQQWILDNIWISDSKVDEFAAGGTLITDDHPYTEYDLLRHLSQPAQPPATKEELLKVMSRSTP
jgi:hypothetical protein